MSKDRRHAYRRNLATGLGASALAHVAVLSLIVLPAPAPTSRSTETPTIERPEPALTVVRLTEVATRVPVATTPSAGAPEVSPVHEPAAPKPTPNPGPDLAVRPEPTRIALSAPSQAGSITMTSLTPTERPAPRPAPAGGSVEEDHPSGGGGLFGGISLGGMFGPGSDVDRCTPGRGDLLGRMRPGAVTAVNNRVPGRSIW
jgi:hypothetical protein